MVTTSMIISMTTVRDEMENSIHRKCSPDQLHIIITYNIHPIILGLEMGERHMMKAFFPINYLCLYTDAQKAHINTRTN